MGVCLTLYKATKTGYTAGPVDYMSDEEYDAFYDTIKKEYGKDPSENWDDWCEYYDSKVNGTFSDGKKHKLFAICNYNLVTKKKSQRRSRYCQKYVNRFLELYKDYLIDTNKWGRFRCSKDEGRFAIPVDEIYSIKPICKKNFFKRRETVRYAFTKEEALKMIQDFIAPVVFTPEYFAHWSETVEEQPLYLKVDNTTNFYWRYCFMQYIDRIWEDGMFLEISW